MRFKYEAFDKFARPVHDTIEADSSELAGEVLRSQGLQVMKIVPWGEPLKTVLPDPKQATSAGIMPGMPGPGAAMAIPASYPVPSSDWQNDLEKSKSIIDEMMDFAGDKFGGEPYVDTDDLRYYLWTIAFEHAFRIAKGEKS